MQEQDFTTPTQDDIIFPNLLIEEEEYMPASTALR